MLQRTEWNLKRLKDFLSNYLEFWCRTIISAQCYTALTKHVTNSMQQNLFVFSLF